MANITDKVIAIREAIYGKDVRESIASGIEAINTEVVNTTSRQNVIDAQEQTRINNENTRQSNEASRISTFSTNEAARQSAFNNSETNRQNTFNTNETVRQNAENTRISNETYRETTFSEIEAQWKQMEHADTGLEVIAARGGEVDLKTRLDKSDAIIQNGALTTPTVGFGMNSVIRNDGKNVVYPKVTIQGKTVINLLGKDGNCEDVSKWGTNLCSLSLDSTNKIFGLNGIKITISSSSSVMNKMLSMLDTSKYYLLSAYVKNGNATNIKIFKETTGGGTALYGTNITDTTKFTRVGLVMKPSDLVLTNYVCISVNGASGQYAYVDGIMINEITASEYALGATALLDKYPYVDSYTYLQSPYIEVRHDNLVRNGNGEEGVGWWNSNSANILTVDNNKFKLTTTGGGYAEQLIPVKPNTNYYLSANIGGLSDSKIIMGDSNGSSVFNQGLFNSGSNSSLLVRMIAYSTGTTYFDSIQLTEGATPPTEYKPCRIERCVLETKLADGDSITYENGEVTGLINWKHRTLFGKDYDWQFNADSAGFKTLVATLNCQNIKQTMVKYNGDIVQFLASDTNNSFYISNNNAYIRISDTDTGWVESINPNGDEVKAFMNGWKALSHDGIHYSMFYNVNTSAQNVSDFANNSCALNTVAYTNGQTTITVDDGNKFKQGDRACILGYSGGFDISNVSGNVLTISSLGTNIPVGNRVVRIDNGTTDLRNLNYCKNNVAPGYEGYQLHYKLANPEPITDLNCHIHGDIPKLDVSDNYLYLDSGMVLGEVANPVSDSTYYVINSKFSGQEASKLKNMTEKIISVYKNLNYNTWEIQGVGQTSSAYGYDRARTLITNFDTSATYTVDYKILATQTPQIGTIACSYTKGIISAINGIQEEINNKQGRDSILDTIVDLSVYEVIKLNPQFTSFYAQYCGTVYVKCVVPYSTLKKTLPIITVDSVQIISNSTDYTKKFTIAILVYKTHCIISASSADPSVISAYTSGYGFYSNSFTTITADCQRRM